MSKPKRLFYNSPQEFHDELARNHYRLQSCDSIDFLADGKQVFNMCDPEIVATIIRYVNGCIAETIGKQRAEAARKKPA